MSLRRVAPVLGRILLLGLLVLIVPACKKKENQSPVLTSIIPTWLANPTGRFPLIVLEFNKAMAPGTINNTNITIEDSVNANPFGGGWTVTYYPGTFQALVVPLAPLTSSPSGPQWDIVVYPQVMSEDGFNINVPVFGGLATRFTVGGGNFKPVFPQPSVVTGATTQGTVTFTWTQAQENSLNIAANYDIYMSTTPGEIDLAHGFILTRTDNGGFTMGDGGANGTLTPGTTYNFIVVCRDNEGNVTVTTEISAQAKP